MRRNRRQYSTAVYTYEYNYFEQPLGLRATTGRTLWLFNHIRKGRQNLPYFVVMDKKSSHLKEENAESFKNLCSIYNRLI